MSRPKRLAIHTLPLLLFAFGFTAVATASILAVEDTSPTIAFVRPTLRFEPGSHGSVKISPNNIPEKTIENKKAVGIPATTADGSVEQAVMAIDTVPLRLNLQAIQ